MARTFLLGRLAIVVLVLGVAGGAALAQINPFGGSAGLELERSDLDLLEAAAAKLYVEKIAEVGSRESWSNPETGNKGRVQLVKLFTHDLQGQDLNCLRLRHDIRLADNDTPHRFEWDRCKMPSGEWKTL